MNKDLIKTRFSKALATYALNACVQKNMAENLLEFQTQNYYENILEIGCGTGFLTSLIDKNIRFKSFTALDIVSECQDYIEKINPEINFINCDIEDFIKENHTKYDLIISNASLQWVEDFVGVVDSLKNLLTKNGELIISTFGIENFKEIYHITGKTLDYYSEQELKSALLNCEISSELVKMDFSTPKEVLKHLQLTGVNALESKAWTKQDLVKFEQEYRKLCNDRISLTYNPIYIKFSK